MPSQDCAVWPLVRSLLLPMTLPAVLQSGLIVFALAFNNFAVPAILQVKVFPAQFWVQFSTSYNFELTWKYGWAMADCRWGSVFARGGRSPGHGKARACRGGVAQPAWPRGC
ncbi:MAG: hypothetical protein Ct9H300mP32_5210 [Verrucomicrobiota bacterium]|nr:MAG: hypothetical protein Ct9H300mP32_5210 [Verrucomicrobiota bacterium]